MTKADLAEMVRDKLGFQSKDSVQLVESVLKLINISTFAADKKE